VHGFSPSRKKQSQIFRWLVGPPPTKLTKRCIEDLLLTRPSWRALCQLRVMSGHRDGDSGMSALPPEDILSLELDVRLCQ